jgi:hypothetical protein
MNENAKSEIRYVTNGFQAGDGRLKVLWIEDLPLGIIPGPGRLDGIEEWFCIVNVEGPLGLRQLIQDAGPIARRRVSDANIYGLSGFPFDVYLTDFRLCNKLAEGCDSQAHQQSGLHAPSGGFLLGLLSSLHHPSHPQAIIPYSAYNEEYGQIWRLASAVCPSTINVLWDERVGKGNRNSTDLIRLIGRRYRMALEQGLKDEIIHIPMNERDRWSSLLDSSTQLPANEQMVFVGEYGLRPLAIGAFFHDVLEPGRKPWVPADEVRRWLETVPVAGPLERQARHIAAGYWMLRCSPLSRALYRIIFLKTNKMDVSGLPDTPPGFPSLFDWKPAQDEDGNGRQVVRLAILFLLIRDHHAREARRNTARATQRQKPLSREAQNILNALQNSLDPSESTEAVIESLTHAAARMGVEAEVDACLEEIRNHQTLGGLPLFDENLDDDTYSELIAQGPLPPSEASVIQLVDPIPSRWDQPVTLNKAKGIGRAISRLWSKTKDENYNFRELLDGDDSHITATEKLVARRYARELMPSENAWPTWLQ